jgi:hypothetical protein
MITGTAAPPSRVSSPRNALTHQHARSSCCLKDIVNALNLQRRALLVRARTDRLRNLFCLLPRNVSVNIRVITRRTQVCFAAHEDYRDYGTTYGPYFFDPLITSVMISLALINWILKTAHLDSDVVQRVWGVNCESNEDHMRFGIRKWS